MYCKFSAEEATRIEVHVFADASKCAIADVAYLRVFMDEDTVDVGFLLGKAKVAPSHGHTIPRLELCAALLAVEVAESIKEQMDFSSDVFRFYTDSSVILCYISNEICRFFIYVANRVSRIRAFCGPSQWNHVPTDQNPADQATRKLHARDLPGSLWIQGPKFLHHPEKSTLNPDNDFPLIDADSDKEIKSEVTFAKASAEPINGLGCERFKRFSSWQSLIRAVVLLRIYIKRRNGHFEESDSPLRSSIIHDVTHLLIREVQGASYASEIKAIRDGSNPPKNSSLLPLNSILDKQGILCVGGRLQRMGNATDGSDYSCHPIIIPKGHVATLLVRHFHSKVHHQGRHITEGAIRAAGSWIVGGKRAISSVIFRCVTCRKLRGKLGRTLMADLPEDRLTTSPPFTFVGVDVFGPWTVTTRRTRGGSAYSKRWGLLFTCFVSRGVHIELIEEMSSTSFINALRRSISLRGPVRQFRSDRGTNFVGAVQELNIDAEFVEHGPVKKYLVDNAITWSFNPPHALHFGGVLERMIGSCRRILDALLLENKSINLTHEVLSTFMAEACAIVNGRPLVPVSSDAEMPFVLSPSLILTHKPCDTSFQLPEFGTKDALRKQWKLVQNLADSFWNRWRVEYLNSLQARSKWMSEGDSFKKGDTVLVKNIDSRRNQWPLGIIEEAFHSEDSKVRKVKVTLIRDNVRTSYVRPICQLVKLIEVD